MPTTTIAERVWIGNGGPNYERVYHLLDGTRMRTKIHVNFYQDQARGTVERWDGSQWREVVKRAGQTLTSWDAVHSALMRHETITDEDFEPDVTEMDAEAWAILTDP